MSAYSARVLSDGALFYWRLGEAAGTAAVDAKGTLNGVYVGSPQLGQPGAISGGGDVDTSVNFTVDGRSINVPADTRHQTLSNFTAETWVYPNAAVPGADVGIINHLYSGTSLPIVLMYGYGQNGAASGQRVWGGFYSTVSGWHYFIDPTDVPLNAWTHYALTYNGTTLRLYRNGVEVINMAAAGWNAAPAGQVLYIGRNYANDWAFRGRIDEVALYPTALSAAQVLAHYNLGTSPPPPPQTVQVPGVYPAGWQASIVGQVVSGDGHLVGGRQATGQFGVPTVSIRLATPAPVGGVPSAQQFGAVTIHATFPKLRPAGLGSAQQFGPVTVTVPSGMTVAGVPSAQLFGVPIAKTVFTVQVPGVGSAQQFGWVTPLNRQFAGTVPGVPSAAWFGVPHIAFWQPLPVGGIPSAQLFGLPFVANVLPVSVCTPLTTVTVGCVSLTAATVGCGPITVTTPADTVLTSTPASCVPLILVDADV